MIELTLILAVGSLVLVLPAIGWICARIGGWSALAREYGSGSLSSATCVRGQDLALGWMNYSQAVTYCVGPEGLRLSMLWLFRFGHRTLLIPWSAIEVEQPLQGRWPFRAAKLRIACGPRSIRATISPKAYELIREHAAAQLRDLA